MNNYQPQEDIAQFMKMCGQEVHNTPTIPSKDILLLRAKLLFEEVSEFIEAAGCFIGMDDEGELTIFTEPDSIPDLVGMYDGLADINYVSYGAANAIGVSMKLGHEEVHGSNMTKAQPDGTILKNEFGKVKKGVNYRKPDLQAVLQKQVK